MTLTPFDRKYRLPHGAVTEIAKATGYSIGYVSEVISGKRKNRPIQRAVARKLGKRLQEAFTPVELGTAPRTLTESAA